MQPQTLPTPDPTYACPPAERDRAPLFPPRDADVEAFRAWMARAAWPEVVFGARLPAAADVRPGSA